MHPQSTLNRLKACLPQMPSSFGVYLKLTLVALCHALEDHLLETPSGSDTLVLVCFQEGKWYLQEADRYGQIAPLVHQVVIAARPNSGFHSHPTAGFANVHLLDLNDEDPWLQEWNLIILDPSYAAMVLCHELSDQDYVQHGVPESDLERKFYGLWTFDRPLVELAVANFIDHTQDHHDTDLAQKLHEQWQRIRTTAGTQRDLTGVVTRIVQYLQSSQEQMLTVQKQSREFWALENQAQKLSRNLAANKLQAFLRMAQRVDAEDPDNPVASLQVAALAEVLGQLLDLPTLRLRRLRLAGLLFRIGLAEAPGDLFHQPQRHTDPVSQVFWPERALIGSQLVRSAMPELGAVADIIGHHLEYWDGTGRPEGLRGEGIPLESRILGLVSHFQALTQPRGIRPAYALTEALDLCQQQGGSRFDPTLLETLSTVVKLVEMGMMPMPQQPSHVPTIWVEE